jgi:prevent-host-death family protein
MENIDINQAAKILSELIKQAAGGDGIVITKSGKPVAKLTAIAADKQCRQFGSAKGLIKISDDFDEPLDDFREYI